jgi:hypothetical protein
MVVFPLAARGNRRLRLTAVYSTDFINALIGIDVCVVDLNQATDHRAVSLIHSVFKFQET